MTKEKRAVVGNELHVLRALSPYSSASRSSAQLSIRTGTSWFETKLGIIRSALQR